MRYITSIKTLYREHIYKLHEEGRFIMLISFTVTFILARLIVYGIVNDFLSPPFGFLFIKGTHIHHLVYGLVLLLIAGFIRIPARDEKYLRISSLLYGIGAALTLDEFAILLSLDANAYYGPAGRISIDVVVGFFLILLASIWHGKFWERVFTRTVAFFRRGE